MKHARQPVLLGGMIRILGYAVWAAYVVVHILVERTMRERNRCGAFRSILGLATAMAAGGVLTGILLGSVTASAQVQLAQEMKMDMAAEGLFEGTGEVIALIPDKAQIVIGHEEIKGFMQAMPMGMGYNVESNALLNDLQPGDRVRFTIDAADKKIVGIEPVPE